MSFPHKVFLPLVSKEGGAVPPPPTPTPSPTPTATPSPTPTPAPGQKLVIDPITRIEGHLRIEAQVENGVVTDAWSSGTMFRGVELVLQGRDPRDAWVFTQRICGVCTTVHAIASVRAVENALGITVPDNARIMRNLIEGAQFIQDHVMHFYHLHALDWVDVVSALSADPGATSALAQSISDWPNSSPAYFGQIKSRLQTFVDSGQLGLFANAYWGHPAYKLPPEGNLLAVAHYLEALEWQREYIRMHAVLGGKNPHLQTYLVGGMALPVDPSNPASLTPQRIAELRAWSAQALDFVSQVYVPDLLLVASFYKEWASLGGGHGNFLSYGDFPTDTSGNPASLWLPQGIITNQAIGVPPQPLDQNQIREYVTHSWYSYTEGDGLSKHPSQGETQPNYTVTQLPYAHLDTDAKYSWLKAPRYNDQPMEVGPLARVLVAYAAGHTRIRQMVDHVLSTLGVGPEALFSTLGRVAARGVETQAIAEQMGTWLDELEANINSGDLAIHNGTLWDPATWPAEAAGWGTTEAPRGGLGHWVRIVNGQIENYQAVVPTTWNGSPRDAQGQRGVWEQALIGTPVEDPARPVEVLRTVHSFDPCMACAVHMVDVEGDEIVRIQVA
ncbi:MAG: nickel-dependent hydrogenase large subunit [Chloroflexi bacterium]|nr:nickel-dependent hydrogenase large subunit [Chloroflexota bacterium]